MSATDQTTTEQDEAVSQSKDSALLKEIRERFRYASDAWKDIKDEAAKDMRYVTGDPWSSEDKKDRKAHGRPALALDELGQYINQAKNQLRQNPRGIKVDPVGEGANDKSAEFRQNLIRGIEYDSNAQRNAYTPAFESCLERSYGFFRITRRYVPGSKDQCIHVKGILNSDSVIYDPDYTEADWSDAMYCFVVDAIPWDKYRSRWPKAVIRDFDSEDNSIAPDWIQDKAVMVAEYFRVDMVDSKRQITHYMTNGVEILEKNDALGSFIPIVPVVGREKYLTEGGKTKRIIQSMVRLARDPYMLYCYLCSQEAEEAKLTPKVPFIGYKGQFESDQVAWESVTSTPRPYLQADVIIDGSNGQVLPLPTRVPFTPNFQAYLMAQDGARRAIQAAMGITPLPTAAQRNNEKSGIALEKIQTEQNIGTFDFTDNFDRALHLAGRILLEWIPLVYTQERHVSVVSADGARKVVKINTPEPYRDKPTPKNPNPEPQQYQVIDDEGDPVGDHGVTISTGPSYESQREAAATFLDQIIQALPTLPIPPPAATKILAMAVRARNLGPEGDQIADVIEGDQNGQAQQGQQAIAQLQQTQQVIQALQVELQKLQAEKQGKIVEHQGKLQQIAFQNEADMKLEDKKLETQIAVAEINTKAQNVNERVAALEDLMKQFHEQAHDVAMQSNQQQHEQDLAQQQGAQQQQLAAQQGQQQQELAAQAQEQPQNGTGEQ